MVTRRRQKSRTAIISTKQTLTVAVIVLKKQQQPQSRAETEQFNSKYYKKAAHCVRGRKKENDRKIEIF